MRYLYQLGIFVYYVLLLIASLFNTKAKLWIQGRRIQKKYFNDKLPVAKRIWFHFASLGEFEQGRVLLEKIHAEFPDYKFIISFFSPSGYEIRKNYALAEKVYYLPLDTANNAKLFLAHIKPSLIFFNKYEYWHHYINEAKQLAIPLFITSSIFRENQIYFKWYGGFQRKILKAVRYFFVQNNASLDLLKSISIDAAMLSGDTRFDRVYEHSLNPKKDELISAFCNEAKIFVAGSTWPADEIIIKDLLSAFPNFKFIIVPHEINEKHILQLKNNYGDDAFLYTEYSGEAIPKHKRILIVNTIGLLNSIYQKASYCYIGGGFGDGIHNTLEAAAYGKPIFFGPNFQKFAEAKDLIKLNAAFCIQNAQELILGIKNLEHSPEKYDNSATASKEYVESQKGATRIIIDYLKKEKYLG